MNVLGICGRDRDAAAALTVDGHLVAAASEESFARVPNVGYSRTGGFPTAAAEACLQRAGLEPADVDHVVIVDDGGSRPATSVNGPYHGVQVREIAPERADAIQASLPASDSQVVIVCAPDQAGMVWFRRQGSTLGVRQEVRGADALGRMARTLSVTLGVAHNDPFSGLDRLSIGAEPEFVSEFHQGLNWSASTGIQSDDEAMTQAISRVSGSFLSSLADTQSPNVKLADLRKRIAASFICQAASIVSGAVDHIATESGSASAVAGGALFSSARFNTEFSRATSRMVSIASVPEARGRAIGAATGDGHTSQQASAFGPAYSDESIKRILDNCRLDYVYEPDWKRLLGRVSGMLTQGKVVAWFQGPLAFGPRPLGTRSVLADPSYRYARQNVNEYLRQLPLDEPVPVAIKPSMEANCLRISPQVSSGIIDAEVRSEWLTKFSGALDWRNHVRLHSPPVQDSRLGDLLDLHFNATGTPGLIEVGLAAFGEPIACSPRDAVRTVYSSAIDALVVGRFLLMKDYWLLRTQDQ